jgi:S1-C subfamily serine protease
VDLLDFVIVALLALAAWTGFRRGAVLQLFTYLGLLIGLVVGAVLAPKFASLAKDQFWQSVIALGTFFAMAGLGDALGWIIGSRFYRITRASKLGVVDAAGGSILGVIAVLLAAWFIAYNLSNGPFPSVSRQIRGSAIVRGVNDLLPNPPYVLGEIKKFLNKFGFPEVFAGIPPAPSGPVQEPSGAQARRAFDHVADSTARVEGNACGRIQEGSSFVVAPHYVLTNAHVVAGMQSPNVQFRGRTENATTVLFDPRIDIAILRVGTTPGPVLHLDGQEVGRGAKGAVAGYPGGGGPQGQPAAVRRLLHAVGKDIYGRSTVTRDVYELQSVVRPGNSGGPFALVDGAVAGVVFAASTTEPNVGYAITSTEFLPDVNRAIGHTNAVSTDGCTR